MSTPEWEDLQRLWQSGMPAAAPALEVIAKQQRRRWAWQLVLASEILITIAGTAMGFWALTWDVPMALFLGVGTLAFTWFAAGASWWARSPRRRAPEHSVLGALDDALHRARVSVRWGLASFWIMVAFLLLVAAWAFYIAVPEEIPPAAARKMLVVIGVWCVYGAVGQAVAVIYYLRRARELTRLEELERGLREA
jgi:hypothetical protein